MLAIFPNGESIEATEVKRVYIARDNVMVELKDGKALLSTIRKVKRTLKSLPNPANAAVNRALQGGK